MVDEAQATVLQTSVDDDVQTLQEQMQALQDQLKELTTKQHEERQEKRERVKAEVTQSISGDILKVFTDDVWSAIESCGGVGIAIKREADPNGGAPVVSFEILDTVKRRAPSRGSTNSSGQRRDLEALFQSVASEEQKRELDGIKNAGQRGRAHSYKKSVVDASGV